MTRDQVLGMIIGCAVGDAYGAPYEFMSPEDVRPAKGYIAGGTHDVVIGEWTDDTAMMVATMDAYIDRQEFDALAIANNFKMWKNTGKFGTRGYVFDIGQTTANAIDRITDDTPYAGSADQFSSGNGSIMRVAPAIAANFNNPAKAVGEAVALSLITHGNSDTITYISAFVDEVLHGKQPVNKLLRHYDVYQKHNTGSIMHSYNVAHLAAHYGSGFEGALYEAAKLGYDTDTNCAVTGMYVGSKMGYESIPYHFLKNLAQHDMLYDMANKMYDIGARG